MATHTEQIVICDVDDCERSGPEIQSYTITTPSKVRVLDLCAEHSAPLERLTEYGDNRPRKAPTRATRERAAIGHAVVAAD